MVSVDVKQHSTKPHILSCCLQQIVATLKVQSARWTELSVFGSSGLCCRRVGCVYSWTAVGDTLLFCVLLSAADRRYAESPICKMDIAVFFGYSLLPHIELDVYSWTAVGHTFCLCCLQKWASLQYIMFSCLVFETAVTGW